MVKSQNGSYDPRFIQSHPLLGLIPAFTLRRLISQAALDEYPKGAVIVKQGNWCESVYLLLSGRCEARGRPALPAAYGPGDAVGVRELLNNEPFAATVVVQTHSVLLRIPAGELERVFASRPAIAGRFSESLRAAAIRNGGGPMPDRGRCMPRRIVSLLSMGRPVGSLEESRALAAAVHRLGDRRVLLLECVSDPDTEFALSDWRHYSSRCQGLKGDFCLQEAMMEAEEGYAVLRVRLDGSPDEPGYIAPLLSHLGMHYDIVLLHLSPELLRDATRPSLREGMVQCDLAYLFTRHGREREALQLLGELDTAQTAHIHLVEEGERWRPDRQYQRNRLAREICQQRIGIAFSCGGAKGLAHIGVIQVLEEHGIEVDVIAGSSMGAYIGAIWASGHDGKRLEAIAREVEGRWGWLNLIDPVFPPRRGFTRSRRTIRRLRSVIGNVFFHQLGVPLRVVATDLATMNRVQFDSGEVAAAVEASIAVPGICEPVCIGGDYFLDGGISEPLPVHTLVKMGIERVIAVNTIPTPAQMRRYVEEGRANGIVPPGLISRYLNYFAHGNLFDTLLRSTDGMQMRIAELACRRATVALRAAAPDGRWHDFGRPGKYIALGRAAAEAALPALLELTKGNRYEPWPRPTPSMAYPLG